MNFRRYTLNDVNQNRFYQLPKFLFEGELLNALSSDAKLLYALLRDRHELSLKNGWVNEHNEVYIIFTRDEMGVLIGCGEKKITRLCNELKENHLFEEEKQGLGKPNLIFLTFVDLEKNNIKNTFSDEKPLKNKEPSNCRLQNRQNDGSRTVKNRLQEPSNWRTSNTNNKDTDFIDTYLSSNDDEIDFNIEDFEATLNENLNVVEYQNPRNYNNPLTGGKAFADFLLSCKQMMVDTVNTKKEIVKISRDEKPKKIVVERFLQLDDEMIRYVYDTYNNNKTNIGNIRGYLLASLFNAPSTFNPYMLNQFNTTYDI